ncbi:MAG: hypothetical protein E7183_07650 [Erysipelotrichaceae bacterium]|nr:hypothetical protein [Erysipelotrichaceae bacterium]
MKKTLLIIFVLCIACFMTSCKKTYTVTFKDGDTVLKTEEVKKGDSAIGLTPEKEGYTFTGWDKSFASVTSDLTVNAQFTINTYTVTFKDGDTVLKTETVNYGSAAVGLTPNKEGYTFTGWDKSFDNIKSDLVVNANFTVNAYTVTFKDGDTVLKIETVNYGESAIGLTPEKVGYTFIGWDKEFDNVTSDLVVNAKFEVITFNVVIYDQESIYQSVTVNYGDTLQDLSFSKENCFFGGLFTDYGYTYEYDVSKEIFDDLVLYVKFSKIFNLTLFVEDEVINVTVLENTIVDDLEVKELPEKKFVGWYYDQEYKQFASIKTVIDSDMTLYAKYIAQVYTVTFETNGGNTLKSVQFSSGTIPSEPMYNPSKLGYEFAYWSLDAEGKKVYNFTEIIKNSFTLYANYVETDYYGLLDSIVPDVIDQDIELPTRRDYFEYNWEISDTSLLSYSGIYNPDLVDKEISISLTINVIGSEESLMFEKNITIKKYELKELITGDIVMGYTSSWYYSGYSEEVLNTVDVLYISFAYVNEDGTLNINGIKTLLSETVAAGHKKGIRVCLSIQGYGEDTKNFSDCAASSTLRVKLAKSMVDAVVEYRLDGIDIDWEYPGSYSGRSLAEDRTNYTLLIKEIRKQLDAVNPEHLLTAAIPAGPWGHERYELNKLVQYFDYINMMSYDLQSSSAGTHHAALYPSSGVTSGCSISETVEVWSSKGVPLEKMCLGIAFYGKDIKTKTSNNNGLGQSAITGGYYKNSAFTAACTNYIDLIGTTVKYNFDYTACAPYMFNTEKRMFYTYENELSIIYKCEYAKTTGLGGVMIWEIGEDNTNTLITAVAQGMGRKLSEKPYIIGGNETFKVGDEIDIKAIKEASDTLLSENLIYTISDNTVATLSGTKVSFVNTGTVTITALNQETGFVYGTLTINVE